MDYFILPEDIDALQKLLIKSYDCEDELRRLLTQNINRVKELELLLELEKNNNVKISGSFSSDESEEELAEIIIQNSTSESNLRDTFGTNSTMLMQYKFDELTKAHSECIKKVTKKNKYLHQIIGEAEILRFKNEQITAENIELNKTIEKICIKYLNLIDRRNDEVIYIHSYIFEMNDELIQ
ncbi:unnamed protein product [Diamesa hyperborea]